MKIIPYWIEKFKSERTWSRRPTEMIREIQNDAYNSALKDVQVVLPGNPCPSLREDIAKAISGLRK